MHLYTSCFIGIPLPEQFRQQYLRIQQDVQELLPDFELANQHIPHITLYYLGSQIVDNFEEIMRKVRTHQEVLRGETLRLTRFDYFRHHDPRVLFVQVEHSSRVEQFYRIMKEELSVYRNEQESRDFHAHLTIGKLKSEATQRSFIDQQNRIMQIGQTIEWTYEIENVTLYGVDNEYPDKGQQTILSSSF